MKLQGIREMAWTAATVVVACQSWAGTATWDGGADGSGTNWMAAANWSGDGLPAPGDTVAFTAAGISVGKVISLGAPQAVDRLSFSGISVAFNVGGPSDVASGIALTLNHVYRNSNVGGVQLLATDIELATNSVWDVAAGYNSNLTVARGIRGDGFSLEKNNTGTLLLCGTNTYSGGTLVRQGTLELGFNQSGAPATNLLNPAGGLELRGGALKVSGKGGVANVQNVSGLFLGSGVSSLSIADANSSNKTRLYLAGIARNAGATLNVVQPTGNTVVSADNGFATTNANDAAGLLGAYVTVGAANWGSNDGANIVAYGGYTTPAGLAVTLPDNAAANVRISNASTDAVGLAASQVTVNTLLVNDATPRTVSLGAGGILRLGALGGVLTPTGAGALTLDGGTLTAGGLDGAKGELIFQNATVVTNAAAIADNGAGAVALTKSGAGTLVQVAPLSHTGGTYVNAGALLLPGGANPLATNAALQVAGGLLNLGGGAQTNVGAVSVLNGTLTNGVIVKFGASFTGHAGLVTASLGGQAGLVKTTSGTLAMTGPNTYTGDTVVLEGSLVGGIAYTGRQGDIAVNGNLIVGSPNGGLPASYKNASVSVSPYTCKAFNPAKNVTVYPNGSVDFGAGDQYMNAGTTLTIIGGYFTAAQFYNRATVNMTGGTFAGNVYGADFNFNSYAASATALVSAFLRNNHTFTVADGPAPVDLLYSGGHDSTSKTITKAGAGVMALGPGGNSYTGGTVVNGGTLLVNSTNLVSGVGNAPVSVGAGATLGGTGFIGGVAGYGNANVTATGSVTGSTTNRATVAPGTLDSVTGAHVIGTLTVGNLAVQTNNVTFGAHSALKITIDAAGAYDRLVVNGTLSLASPTDRLELSVADANALHAGTYALVTFQQLAAAGQLFDTVVGLPLRGRLEYTATGINYVVNPKGTVALVR